MMYADIIVDISHEKLDRSFQYRVPQELESQIHIGMVVSILLEMEIMSAEVM